MQLGNKVIRKVQDRTPLQDLESLESTLAEVMATDNCREGIHAFLEKRKPDFRLHLSISGWEMPVSLCFGQDSVFVNSGGTRVRRRKAARHPEYRT